MSEYKKIINELAKTKIRIWAEDKSAIYACADAICAACMKQAKRDAHIKVNVKIDNELTYRLYGEKEKTMVEVRNPATIENYNIDNKIIVEFKNIYKEEDYDGWEEREKEILKHIEN